MASLDEIGKLLVFISSIDNRRAGPEVTLAWHRILVEYDYRDLLAAAEHHFGTTPDYLVPAHLAITVRTMRAEIDRRRAAASVDDPARIEFVRQQIIAKQRREIDRAPAPGPDDRAPL